MPSIMEEDLAALMLKEPVPAVTAVSPCFGVIESQIPGLEGAPLGKANTCWTANKILHTNNCLPIILKHTYKIQLVHFKYVKPTHEKMKIP